jgi:hypothetical protein
MAALKGETAMPDLKNAAYRVGDTVRLKFGARLVRTVTEARGTYSPDRPIVYRVRVVMSPEPLMVEVQEDEIENA